GRHCAAGGNYRRRVGSGGSGDSVGAGGVGPFSRPGAERRGVLCTPFAAGALLLQVGVAVVAGVRGRWSWLALGRAVHAVRSGGAAPTGWGRRLGVEWGCCPYGWGWWGLVWEPRPPGRMAGASPPRGQDHS